MKTASKETLALITQANELYEVQHELFEEYFRAKPGSAQESSAKERADMAHERWESVRASARDNLGNDFGLKHE